jgi:probable HAF family extracellular repeat protein
MTSPARANNLLAVGIAIGAVLVTLAVGSAGAAGYANTDPGDAPSIQIPGFVLDKGRYTTFQVPGAATETLPGGIDERGRVVGEYNDATGEHGFLRDRRGRLMCFDVPGALATAPTRINNRGQIVGAYSEVSRNLKAPDSMPRGFRLDDGRLTRIDAPGAVFTQAIGVNDHGQVVGDYVDDDGKYHGFVWQRGRLEPIDVPGSVGTDAFDINNRGQIVGTYGDAGGGLHGFVRDRRGRLVTIDAPGAVVTAPYGLNDRGQIVGVMSTDPTGFPAHGFVLRRGVDGPFTQIDVPRAPNTVPFDINNRGQIVGFYENPDAASEAGLTSGAALPSAPPGALRASG